VNPDVVIILTAVFASTASALVGCFLLLRRMTLISDAISHSVLPGIVAAYWLTSGQAATIPALLGAGAMGLLTVAAVEALARSGRVKNDAAIGIVFPLFFSLGVIAVSLWFRNVHLDLDAVLYGEIAYAPFNTLTLVGVTLPESWLLMGGLALANALFVGLLYKELKLSTFDAGLAAALGFAPGLVHYGLMTLLSLTTVGAFQSVGAILVIALIIVPPATAYLLTQRLPLMIATAIGVGVVASVGGYVLAIVLDASIAGMMATVAGACFFLALLFSPTTGVIATLTRRRRQRHEFATRLLVSHVGHHGGRPISLAELQTELAWHPARLERARAAALRAGLATLEPQGLTLTEEGNRLAASLVRRPGQAAPVSA